MALDHTARLSCSQIWVAYEEVLGCWRRPEPVYRSVSGHDAFEVRHYSVFDMFSPWRPKKTMAGKSVALETMRR